MTLLNTLMATCTTLSLKVAQLEQDKITQALKILKLKKRVKKLEKKRRSKSSGLKRLRKVGTSQRVKSSTKTVVSAQADASKQGEIAEIDADEEITLVNMETQVDIDAELQGRTDSDNVAEPTVFDDEEVTMTMAQTLIKMKAEKARLLDEQMAKRFHDEEIEKATAREKQEKDDLERAKVLQQQYGDKEENIDWNAVVEQVQEKRLDNIRKYQNLKRKPISIAQARKNMIIYLKNMAGYKMEHFIEISKEDVQNMLEIVPVAEFKVEALQVKFHIDSESLNKVSVLVVLDLSNVANPLYSLKDKDLLKSNDPQTLELSVFWRFGEWSVGLRFNGDDGGSVEGGSVVGGSSGGGLVVVGSMGIDPRIKWLWKNMTDAKNMVIHKKSRLVTKGKVAFEELFAPIA
nr:hypothetical protein [Tanacetum cinerariifolium]